MGISSFWRGDSCDRLVQVELSFVTVVLQLLAGLGIALLLDKSSKLLETIRTGFLVRMRCRQSSWPKPCGVRRGASPKVEMLPASGRLEHGR
jgi:hypothetical protein